MTPEIKKMLLFVYERGPIVYNFINEEDRRKLRELWEKEYILLIPISWEDSGMHFPRNWHVKITIAGRELIEDGLTNALMNA